MPGTLYLVATPIGNLQDITLRAIETLRSVDLIACEDTRHTRKLLNHFGIKNKLVSYHEHNETQRTGEFLTRLQNGESIAVASDAGTPAINDPGYRLVTEAIGAQVDVVSIPGPTALISALVASGLPTDSFFFGGFLPSKKNERRRRLSEAAGIPATLIFYETPHRLAASLADCLDVLGERAAVVARELTKMHEEIVRGPLSTLASKFDSAQVRGEIVLLVERAVNDDVSEKSGKTMAERVKELEASGQDRRTALKQAAKEFGLTRSEAYRDLQIAKKS